VHCNTGCNDRAIVIGSALRLDGQIRRLDETRQPWSAALAQAILSVSEEVTNNKALHTDAAALWGLQ
jgi:hypothetical protein